MENETENWIRNVTGYPMGYITVMRVNSVIIFMENLIVALCLYTHRNTFSRREFWLHLVSLNINDIFVGIALFLLSFINSDIFNKTLRGCAVLMTLVIIPQLTLPYNVLCICLYRFMFLIFSDKRRFVWKTKMTVFQIVGFYLTAALYTIIPFLLWAKNDYFISQCSPINMFGLNTEKAFIFIGTGLFLPLIVLNVLYCITFRMLRRHWRIRLLSLRNTDHGTKTLHDSEFSSVDPAECHKISTRINRSQQRASNILFVGRKPTKPEIKPSAKLYTYDEDNGNIRNVNFPVKQEKENKFDEEMPQLQIKRAEAETCLTSSKKEKDEAIEMLHKYRPRNDSDILTQCDNFQSDLKLKNSSKRIKSPLQRSMIYYRRNHQRQSLVLIGIILLLINVTTLPSVAIRVVPGYIPRIVRYALGLLVMNNSLLNPWVYALQSTDFRAALRENIRKASFDIC